LDGTGAFVANPLATLGVLAFVLGGLAAGAAALFGRPLREPRWSPRSRWAALLLVLLNWLWILVHTAGSRLPSSVAGSPNPSRAPTRAALPGASHPILGRTVPRSVERRRRRGHRISHAAERLPDQARPAASVRLEEPAQPPACRAQRGAFHPRRDRGR